MPGIDGIKFSENYGHNLNKDNEVQKNNHQQPGKNIKTKNEHQINPIKRPISIDNSNNIFYVNYKGENQTVKIEPGEYDLLELRRAIQDKVNEKFGIDKVKVELTGSGSDRLVQGEDSKIFDFLI